MVHVSEAGSYIEAASRSTPLPFSPAPLFSPPATNTRPSFSTAEAKAHGALVGIFTLVGMGLSLCHVPFQNPPAGPGSGPSRYQFAVPYLGSVVSHSW